MNREHETSLADAIQLLVCELRESRQERQGNIKHVILHRLAEMEERIMATQTQLAADLAAVLAQQKKTQGEIAALQASSDALTQKITDLEAVIAAGGEASQELTDAVAAVKAQAQVVDDQIPDVVVPPPTA